VIQRFQEVEGAGGGGTTTIDLQSRYVELICQVIEDIQRAVEQGQVWPFENLARLRGETESARALVRERWEALQQLIHHLDEILQELQSGALTPTEPASREGLWNLWRARHPRESWEPDSPPVGHPARWSDPIETEETAEVLRRRFPSLGRYARVAADSAPGTLPPDSFPIWWVLACHRLGPGPGPGPSPAPTGGVTPADLDLTLDSVIYISRTDGVVTGWDWEPRGASHGPFRSYEWHYDEAARRVYIIVDGRQYDLRPYGRLAPHR
jgi:hypothetical protein